MLKFALFSKLEPSSTGFLQLCKSHPNFSLAFASLTLSGYFLLQLYTSGSTGKPKGVQHTTGGYMVGAATTFKYVFDHHPDTDVFWCTADCGWITGHSYVTYGMCYPRVLEVL